MYNALCNLLVQNRYIEASILFASVLILVLFYLHYAHYLAIKLHRSKKNRWAVVLFVVVAIIFFLIVLIGPDLYNGIGKYYA